jgi:ABC-type Fe3+ transport system permease subunit
MLLALFVISVVSLLAGLIVYRIRGDDSDSGPAETGRGQYDDGPGLRWLGMSLLVVLVFVIVIATLALALRPNVWEPLHW